MTDIRDLMERLECSVEDLSAETGIPVTEIQQAQEGECQAKVFDTLVRALENKVQSNGSPNPA